MSGATDIVVGVFTVLASGGLVLFIIRGLKDDLLEMSRRQQTIKEKISQIKVPNVGEDMCLQKSKTIIEGMKFLHDTNERQASKWEKDHDLLVMVSQTLKAIEYKIDKLNNKG
jgi:hypothetical protein